MKIHSIIYIVFGGLILASIALAYWVDQRWLLLAALVALSIFQAGFTGFCVLERLLLKLGVVKHGHARST